MSGEAPLTLSSKAQGTLSFREALQAPCLSCPTSPCCTYLMVLKMQLETLMDMDYALYLVNFEGILLGLGPDASVRVYFHQPCGYLDVPSGLCTVHGTPTQPSICVHYNAHACQYRHAMTVDTFPKQPLADRRRMQWYAEHVLFADDRQIASVPEWADVIDAFEALPLQRQPAPPPAPDAVTEEWRAIVLSPNGGSGRRSAPRRFGDPIVSNPCQGCAAWCCQTLVFSRDAPENASQLDYFRYCVGFPGVELGIAEDGWAVIIRTTCRHLDANHTCSVYGTDDRPLKCSYYDALKCTYRVHFGTPRPDQLVRLTRDQFPALADSVVFDDTGRIMALPPLDVLRDRLEDDERTRAGLTG
jgi:hypothetical protein